MKEGLVYQDLIYFGYDWSEEGPQSARYQDDFIKEIKEKFPHVGLRNAYDSIKGYRQEVYLHEEDNDEYNSWLIGNDWFDFSMVFQLIMMSANREPEQKEKFEKYFALAKKQHPQSFKAEALK